MGWGARSSRGDEGGSRGDEGDDIFGKEGRRVEMDGGRGGGIDGDVEAEPCTISL